MSAPRSVPPALLLLFALPLFAACSAKLGVDLAASTPDGVSAMTLAAPYVDLEDSDGAYHSFETVKPEPFELLDGTGGDRTELLSENDASAHYTGVRARFDVDGAYLTRSDGTQWPITLAAQADYADVDLDLGENDSATLILTLELPFSLVDRSAGDGDFELRPVLRVAARDEAATLGGSIPKSLVEADDCRAGRSAGSGVAVYLYEGSDITPTDYLRSDNVVNLHQPVAAAFVAYSATDEAYDYGFYNLAPGNYTAAWTCQADAERPDSDDGLVFQSSANVSVAAAASTTLDFSE